MVRTGRMIICAAAVMLALDLSAARAWAQG